MLLVAPAAYVALVLILRLSGKLTFSKLRQAGGMVLYEADAVILETDGSLTGILRAK